VKVSVGDVRVEHQVKLADFTQWLERKGGSPRDIFQRKKLRSIDPHLGPRACADLFPGLTASLIQNAGIENQGLTLGIEDPAFW